VTQFPRTDVAVIVLVTTGDSCFLARQAEWPAGHFATIAGFLEPGESLEDSVAREVAEESGLQVQSLAYHSSQPWPFPGSIMVGYHARVADTRIDLTAPELDEGRWFTRRQLAHAVESGAIALPPRVSISYRLIQDCTAPARRARCHRVDRRAGEARRAAGRAHPRPSFFSRFPDSPNQRPPEPPETMTNARQSSATIRPSEFQPPLPMDRLILEEPPGEESVPMDVLFVGGGPAGLAGAIELARLVAADNADGGGIGDVEIGVLEKAAAPGEHCLSGAVVVPDPFRELFPDVSVDELPFRRAVDKDRVYLLSSGGQTRLPTPPTMRNHGNYVASICEIVRWMAERAEEAGVNVFTGFPADALLMQRGDVVGVRTAAVGLDREGNPGAGYMPPTDVTARVTVLSEGTRGSLTQAFLQREGIRSPNPQIYALGVKELWQVKKPLDAVVHTLGWPLPNDAFGGSWMYPMGDDLVSLGLVVGLDYRQHDLDVHVLLQRLKRHPLFAPQLEGGELLEWGGKTIPEGGYYSLPDRMHGSGLIVAGDAAGLVDVPSLKGIHYAVQSGIFAARTIFDALKRDDTSAAALAGYDQLVRDSFIGKDLYRTRNMRLAFKSGFYSGGLKAALMTVSGGTLLGGRIEVPEDAEEARTVSSAQPGTPDGDLSVSKLDAVYRSGNTTRDDIPSHLIVGDDVPPHVAEFYEHMCPAGVYELDGGKLVVNPPNCIDCKATDVLGPRWTPREGGSGPSYKRM